MAGDWIKMRANLDTDPRIIALAAELSVPELHVVGCCWKLWSWADAHTEDGNAICVTEVTLDRFTGVTGFAAALRKVGWLEGSDKSLSFPRFSEHNGQTAKKRGETAIRVAKFRNAKRVTDVTPKVLPEKRREEKKDNTPIVPKERKAKAGKPDSYTPDFELFWNAYPPIRKTKKQPTWIAWKKAICMADPAAIIEAAGMFAESPMGKGEFCPGPEPWLNQCRWEDDRSAWQKGDGKTVVPQSRMPTDEELANWNPYNLDGISGVAK